MSLGLAFWILMLVSLVVGAWSSWPNFRIAGSLFMISVLLVLLGWKVFGAPIQG